MILSGGTHSALTDFSGGQVNWPKLNTPRWANEGYQQALGSVRKDKIIGPFVTRHERGGSIARLGHMEEGKKRIQ